MVRIVLRALVILAVITILDGLGRESVLLGRLFDVIGPVHFILFSLACAVGLQQARALAGLLVITTVLCCAPSSLADLTRCLIPLGAGFLAGRAMRMCLAEVRDAGGA